ncbi:hypothetical protein [Flavobacterium turcicum]|uniref:Uncharacterized protein n=1 Tax=Flavobacterium turcicum TaxID=2764718 RepID=A0ABR7JEJ7_9FLAO|nr:hypothetical protein [Flavobacterium turcicum]MBC5862879.1 hypothetical protein [Flavobacterium turcicum]NHL01611.1 hypothetical protein [Flavobacterium turcicum]
MKNEEIVRITPQKAMELLIKDGYDLNIEQVTEVLDFLYEMAEIVVDTYLDKENIVNLQIII